MPRSLSSGSIVGEKSTQDWWRTCFSFSCPGLLYWWALILFFLTIQFLVAWFWLNSQLSRIWLSQLLLHAAGPVQVSGQCPEGGDRACRSCLGNEITSHSGPVHQKTHSRINVEQLDFHGWLCWVKAIPQLAKLSRKIQPWYFSTLMLFWRGFEVHLTSARTKSCKHRFAQKKIISQIFPYPKYKEF